MTEKSGTGRRARTAIDAVFERLDERQLRLDDIVAAIAHLPRGSARSRLSRRAVEELGLSVGEIEAAIQQAKPTWTAKAWAAEAAHLKKRISRLISEGGPNGEIARCRLALDEALRRLA